MTAGPPGPRAQDEPLGQHATRPESAVADVRVAVDRRVGLELHPGG